MTLNQPSSRHGNDAEHDISKDDTETSSTDSDYSLSPHFGLHISIMNHAVAVPTAQMNRTTYIFDALVQRWIPELGASDPMHMEVAEFPLGCVFRIETDNEYETVVLLDPHEIPPRELKGNPDFVEIVDQHQDQPQAPSGCPETAPPGEDDPNDISDTTEVNPPEISIDVSQDEHGKFSLRYPDGDVKVMIREE